MCTFTLYEDEDHCFITMNRDELITREEIGELNIQASLAFPIDNISQGTWSGVNQEGVALCLLNRYHNKERLNPLSRGGIIPAALAEGQPHLVSKFLTNLAYTDYNPFDLLMISTTEKTQFQWDGIQYQQLNIEAKPWYMFSSSSINTEQVLAYRESIFQKWIQTKKNTINDPAEILKGFHLVQDALKPSCSVFMNREHSHTKSLIQICLDEVTQTLNYYPHAVIGDSKQAITCVLKGAQ